MARYVLGVHSVSVNVEMSTMPRPRSESEDDQAAAPALGSLRGPATFGPYRVIDVLGRGGMGVVYHGEHIETGEAVAIKTLFRVDDGHHLAAIRREIPALRRLRHPGIVRFIDHGEIHGVPWVMMPLLRGRTLCDHIKDLWPHPGSSGATVSGGSTVPMGGWAGVPRPQPPAAGAAVPPLGPTLTLIHRLCTGLAYLHGENLVHRDLKPANIFLQDGDRPVLIDLGFVLHFGGAGREELDIGEIGGTPAYMAPEQIDGDMVDARADLYALGCILYECATGRRPFTGSNAGALRRQHLHEPPVPPSCLVPGIPRGLEDLILKLLEKRPEDRIGYAADVAATLVTLGAAAEPDEGPPARAYLYRSTFKGRKDVLSKLQELTRRTVEQRISGIALVRGESGMGKTRLVRELARRRPRGCVVLTGLCVAPGAGDGHATAAVAAPLHPLRPALQEAVDRARRSNLEAARLFGPRREVLVPYVPELREQGSHADRPAASSSPPERARARVIAALRDTLRALSEPSPLLLVIDDLQWADELTLGLLEALANEEGDDRSGLLIIGTCRVEEPRPELEELAGAARVSTVDLGKLDARSIEEMVAGMLAHSMPRRAALDALVRNADGNPFFVAEILLTAIAEGILRRDADSRLVFDESVAPRAFSSPRLPQKVAALLERRLDLLDIEARQLAGWAAVLGHELDDELLLAGPWPPRVAGEALVTLQARLILEETEGRRLRFVHDKLRETAYQRLDEGVRREWHLRAGEALQARYGEMPERAPLLAHHFAGAGLHVRAGEYFTLAAQHAAAVHANRDALRFYPLALDAFARAGVAPPEPATFHEGFGDALRLVGQQKEARDAYEKALHLPSPGVQRARLQRKIGRTWELHHKHAEALGCYELAEAALREHAERAEEWKNEWIQLHLDRISVHYWQADVGRLDELLNAMRPVVESSDAALHRAHYLHALTQRDILALRFVASAETVRYAVDCLEAYKKAGGTPDEHWVLGARCSLAVILMLHGDLDEAEQEMHDALPIAVAGGELGVQTRCLTYLTVIQRRRGLVDLAEKCATSSLKLTEAEGVREYEGAALGTLAWCALRRGDLAKAEQQARRALALWGQLDLMYPFQWLARLPLCRVELERGDLSGAVEQAEAVLSQPQQRLPESLEGALQAAVGAAAEGRTEQALRSLALALQGARNGGFA